MPLSIDSIYQKATSVHTTLWLAASDHIKNTTGSLRVSDLVDMYTGLYYSMLPYLRPYHAEIFTKLLFRKLLSITLNDNNYDDETINFFYDRHCDLLRILVQTSASPNSFEGISKIYNTVLLYSSNLDPSASLSLSALDLYDFHVVYVYCLHHVLDTLPAPKSVPSASSSKGSPVSVSASPFVPPVQKCSQAPDKNRKNYAQPLRPLIQLLVACLIFLVLAVVVIVIFVPEHDISSSNPTIPPEPTFNQEPETIVKKAPQPVPAPENGHVFQALYGESLAPLTITTSYGGGYYFIVQPYPSSSKMNRLCFYANSNSKVDFDIPVGTYEIYYAVGDIWYGTLHLFGDDTSYYRLDEIFDFEDGYGWEIELKLSENGNLDSDFLDPADFPN